MAGPDYRFDLPPAEAVNFFRGKGLQTSFAWQDVWQREHEAAFTVAKMADVDLLSDVRDAVDRAIADGATAAQFSKELKPRLQEAGWWGQKEVTDPLTGETQLVQLGSSRRLRTIFRVNVQTAYAAGDWQQIQESKEEAPYLMYDAIDDANTRPEHRAWDGTVLPVDDPWWSTHRPPNGWNCRCSVVQLSGAELKGLGKQVDDKPPPSRTREYTNPRTGEVSQVPVGIDPGFGYNPGADRYDRLAKNLVEKAASAPADLGAWVVAQMTKAQLAAFDRQHAQWVDQVLQRDVSRGERQVVGTLSPADVAYLKARGIEPQKAGITVEDRLLVGAKARRHAAAGNALTVDEWKGLPAALRDPERVLFDLERQDLLYVVAAAGGRMQKIVVQVDRSDRGQVTNSVRTAFKVQARDLNNPKIHDEIRRR